MRRRAFAAAWLLVACVDGFVPAAVRRRPLDGLVSPAGASQNNLYCDMSGTTPYYRGLRYPQSDSCTGQEVALESIADGSCVDMTVRQKV